MERLYDGLFFLTQTVADAIVPAVILFIESIIKRPDWYQREAAVMTFASILERTGSNCGHVSGSHKLSPSSSR